MNSSAAPIDVWSAKQMGAQSWVEHGSWPVSDEEARALWKSLEQAWLDSVAEAGPGADALLATYKVNTEFWQLLHTMLLVSRLRERGFTPVAHARTPYASLCEAAGTAQLAIERPFALTRPGSRTRIKAESSALLRSLTRGTGHVKAGDRSWPRFVSWGYPTADHLRYAARAGRRPAFLHPTLLPRAGRRQAGGSAARESFIEAFVGRIEIAVRGHGITVDPNVRAVMRTILAQWVYGTNECIAAIEKALAVRPGSVILAESLGSALFKCFSIAATRRGHEVVGFPHGHVFGQHDASSIVYNEFAVVNRYVATNPASAALQARLAAKYPVPTRSGIEIDVLEGGGYRELWRELQADPLPPRIRTIMFMEFPLTPYRYETTYTYWVFQARLLVQAAKAARKLGYRTILKRHPDRLAESDGFYDGIFDEMITDPFERSYQRADAFFFSYVGTTTFPFALLTNRPVIVLDRILDEIWPDVREQLEARCRVVPCRLEANGDPRLETAELKSVLELPVEMPDYRFAETYLFIDQ